MDSFSTKQFSTQFSRVSLPHIHTAPVENKADVRYTGRLIGDTLLDIFDFFQKDIIFGNGFAYFVAGMHHGRMITVSEFMTDLRQGHVQKISAQIHGDLSRGGYLSAAAIGFQIFDCDMIKAGNHIHDDAAIDLFPAHGLDNIFQCFGSHIDCNRSG